MVRCLYVVARSMLWDLIIPRHAVTAGPLRPPGGHHAWNPEPWR